MEEKRHFIIGTAGHVDHGKTTLIQYLTGQNTDRLKEEQERGITIEPGFAYFDLPNGERAGIVDVPGHQRFVGNMLTGVVGMDMALVVVAANEGIMPQTREHLDILGLSGVQNCIVALTKCDMVEPEKVKQVTSLIQEYIKDTSYGEARILPVSSVTGEGMDALVEEIVRISEQISLRDASAIARLPIDRVFQLGGIGTIVTGTLVSGTIRKNQELMLYPSGKMARVRSIQVHNQDMEEGRAGQRVAINVTGIKKEEIHRGNTFAQPDSLLESYMADVRLQALKSAERVIRTGMRFHLFVGTHRLLCRVVLLDKEELQPGQECLAQLRLESPTPLIKGDRFVLRYFSPVETIAGGVIIHGAPGKKKAFDPAAVQQVQALETGALHTYIVQYLRNQEALFVDSTQIGKALAVPPREVKECLAEMQTDLQVFLYETGSHSYGCLMERKKALEEKILDNLWEYHRTYPYRHGRKKAEILSMFLGTASVMLREGFLQNMVLENSIVIEGNYVAAGEFSIQKDKIYNQVMSTCNNTFRKAGYHFIPLKEAVFHKVEDSVVQDIVNLGLEQEKLVELDDGVYTMKALMDPVEEYVISHIREQGVISVIELRDHFNTSRKNAKLMFDYLDRRKVTEQRGAASQRMLWEDRK